MLNIEEYNECLYRSLDERNKRKNIIQNYSGYLAHAKNYKYVYKEGDRYFYPEDIKRMKERKANLLTKKEIENSANTNSKIRALKNEQSKTVEALMNARSNAEIDDIVNKNRQKVAATKLMNETVAQERANKQAKAEAARADQNARAYDNNKAAADAQKRALHSTGPVAQQKIEAAKSNNYQNNRKAEEAQKIANQQNSTIGKQKAKAILNDSYANNKAASEHESDRYSKENIQKQNEANEKLTGEYQNEKKKAVGGSRDVSISAQDKAKKDSEYKKSVNDILSKLSLQMDRLYNSNHPKGSIDNKEYRSAYDEASRQIEDIYKNIYGSWLPVSAGQETQRLLDNWRNNQEAIMNDAKKKVKNMKKDYEVIAAGKLRHSSFSISDDEMKNYLVHGSIKPEK